MKALRNISFLRPLLRKFVQAGEMWWRWRRRREIDFLDRIIDKDVTIISSNCFAGSLYQDLNRRYTSPTVGLFFLSEDFQTFIADIGYYLNAPLEFIGKSKCEACNARRCEKDGFYPIGFLRKGDTGIEVHFLHYDSEKEARRKWVRRCARVNPEKIMVIGFQQNWFAPEHLTAFENISNVKAKYFFTSDLVADSPSAIELDCFRENGEVGNVFGSRRKICYRKLIDRMG